MVLTVRITRIGWGQSLTPKESHHRQEDRRGLHVHGRPPPWAPRIRKMNVCRPRSRGCESIAFRACHIRRQRFVPPHRAVRSLKVAMYGSPESVASETYPFGGTRYLRRIVILCPA